MSWLRYTIQAVERTADAPLAQLDRVFDYESKGRGFESRRAHFPESLVNKGFQVFLYRGKSRRFNRFVVYLGTAAVCFAFPRA